jgi:hypothetical protein
MKANIRSIGKFDTARARRQGRRGEGGDHAGGRVPVTRRSVPSVGAAARRAVELDRWAGFPRPCPSTAGFRASPRRWSALRISTGSRPTWPTSSPPSTGSIPQAVGTGEHNFFRGGPLTTYDRDARERLPPASRGASRAGSSFAPSSPAAAVMCWRYRARYAHAPVSEASAGGQPDYKGWNVQMPSAMTAAILSMLSLGFGPR